MAERFAPMYLAGSWTTSNQTVRVQNPYDGSDIAVVSQATSVHLDQAIGAAEAAAEVGRAMPTYERARLLLAIRDGLAAKRDELIRTIVREAGKPIREAEVEADRGLFTLELAAEEAKRIDGEVMPLDLMPASKGRFGIVRRFPIGPIAGISPFNFPLNLALHKVAPALASGNPIVLKPPTLCPLTMLLVAGVCHEVGVPSGMLSVLPMGRDVGDRLVEDDRFKLLSFTGSPDIGWNMKARAGRKKVVLELGGNAGVMIDEDSDLDVAVQRVVFGAYAYAGQVCISVQRVFVHAAVYDDVRERLVAAAKAIKHGDPMDPATQLGPMISFGAAKRAREWIVVAERQGARLLTGGAVDGPFLTPAIIEHAPRESFVCSREAFAPLMTLFRVDSFAEGLAGINDSVYGLQAGVFTNRLEHALAAYERLEVGGVIVNDVPTYRIDHMPYGGVKDSGLSREGVRYTIEDMTEPRLLVFNRLASQSIDA